LKDRLPELLLKYELVIPLAVIAEPPFPTVVFNGFVILQVKVTGQLLAPAEIIQEGAEEERVPYIHFTSIVQLLDKEPVRYPATPGEIK
jgi:hypothetical protein